MTVTTSAGGGVEQVRAECYADVPPDGYTLASNRQRIDASDMIFFPGNHSRDAEWARPKLSDNIIGDTVVDHWPSIMGLAVKR